MQNSSLSDALETHRPVLTGHCYRMLGSPAEADDAVQETFVRAMRHLERFEGRAALRTWLVSIATRVCLDARDERSRRLRPMDLRSAGTPDEALATRPSSEFVEPIPDAAHVPTDASPAELAMLRQSVRLAFVAALQLLPPRQRAVLLLAEVFGWSAAEIAERLDLTVAAVNSALQRARATLDARRPNPDGLALDDEQTVDRYVRAFERYDVDALTAILHAEVTMCMPPYDLWLQGRDAFEQWLRGPGVSCRNSRVIPVQVNGTAGFAQYRPGPPGQPHRAWALVVPEASGGSIRAVTSFLDVDAVFPRFGLPDVLPG